MKKATTTRKFFTVNILTPDLSHLVRFSCYFWSIFLLLAHPPSVKIAHECPSKAKKIPNSDFYVEQWRGVTEISREAACNLYHKNFVRCYPSANLT